MTDTTDRIVTQSTDRGIVRCAVKGCRRAHSVTYTTESEIFAFNGRPVSRTFLLRPDGRRVEISPRYRLDAAVTHGFTCSGCGGRAGRFALIVGRFSESKPCNARCTGAVSPSCDCQCGGENHASAHVAL